MQGWELYTSANEIPPRKLARVRFNTTVLLCFVDLARYTSEDPLLVNGSRSLSCMYPARLSDWSDEKMSSSFIFWEIGCIPYNIGSEWFWSAFQTSGETASTSRRMSAAEGRSKGSSCQHFLAIDHKARRVIWSAESRKSGVCGSLPLEMREGTRYLWTDA